MNNEKVPMHFALVSFLLVAFGGDNDFWNRCIFPEDRSEMGIEHCAKLKRSIGNTSKRLLPDFQSISRFVHISAAIYRFQD